ncbi:MAG: DUF131 domain-containing protein [Candidatus Methanomethylicia archaeon]
MLSSSLVSIGWLMVMIGIIFIFIAVVLMIVGSMKGTGKIHGGGAVLIGPIPIVFGTSREIFKIMLILAIATVTIILIFTFLTV